MSISVPVPKISERTLVSPSVTPRMPQLMAPRNMTRRANGSNLLRVSISDTSLTVRPDSTRDTAHTYPRARGWLPQECLQIGPLGPPVPIRVAEGASRVFRLRALVQVGAELGELGR